MKLAAIFSQLTNIWLLCLHLLDRRAPNQFWFLIYHVTDLDFDDLEWAPWVHVWCTFSNLCIFLMALWWIPHIYHHSLELLTAKQNKYCSSNSKVICKLNYSYDEHFCLYSKSIAKFCCSRGPWFDWFSPINQVMIGCFCCANKISIFISEPFQQLI